MMMECRKLEETLSNLFGAKAEEMEKRLIDGEHFNEETAKQSAELEKLKNSSTMSNLESNKTYNLGDFMLRLKEDGSLRITADYGIIHIRPKADNAIEVKSIR